MSKFINGYITEYPEHEEYFTLVFNEEHPIENIFIGLTHPFSSYSVKRTDTENWHLFEYILSGKGEITIEGKKIPLSEGNVFFLKKGSVHDYRSDKNAPLEKIWVAFSSDYIDKMLDCYHVETGVYNVSLKHSFVAVYELAKSDARPYDKFFSVADHLHKIITTLSRSAMTAENDLSSAIRNELLANVYSKGNLDDIAKKLYITKSTLIRAFKKKYGLTPYKFLLNEKMAVASTLLASTDMNVKNISEHLCFTDEHYFSYLFKLKNGCTPSEFRQRSLKK